MLEPCLVFKPNKWRRVAVGRKGNGMKNWKVLPNAFRGIKRKGRESEGDSLPRLHPPLWYED